VSVTGIDRIQRALREVRVRFARDGEAMLIAQMVHTSHAAVPLTPWDHVYPYWIVAEKDDELIGCLQLCYSLPVARIEFLSFVHGLPYRTRALAVKALLNLARITLQHSGAHVIAGCVGFDQKPFKEILKAEGCTVLTSGNVLAKEVA
jgi:hypothetical protein